MIDHSLKHVDVMVTVVAVWMVAGLFAWGAVERIGDAGDVQAVVAAAQKMQPQPFQLAREPMAAADYTRIAEAVRPYVAAELKVEALTTHLAISGSRLDLHPALMAAFQEITLAAPNAQWTVETLCVGLDCKPAVLSATVKAYQIKRSR